VKADARRKLLDHLETVLLAGMAAKVAVVRADYAGETLPDIAAVYIDEEDYTQVVKHPCLLLFSRGPVVLEAMTEAYQYGFPVDICAFDVPTTDGLPALWNRLYAYQGCLTDLLLSSHAYEAGYWDAVRPLEPVDPRDLADERFGSLGRLEGYRFGFQLVLTYP
jgi:hypothetical protein